jgi:hypothetical protein
MSSFPLLTHQLCNSMLCRRSWASFPLFNCLCMSFWQLRAPRFKMWCNCVTELRPYIPRASPNNSKILYVLMRGLLTTNEQRRGLIYHSACRTGVFLTSCVRQVRATMKPFLPLRCSIKSGLDYLALDLSPTSFPTLQETTFSY